MLDTIAPMERQTQFIGSAEMDSESEKDPRHTNIQGVSIKIFAYEFKERWFRIYGRERS